MTEENDTLEVGTEALRQLLVLKSPRDGGPALVVGRITTGELDGAMILIWARPGVEVPDAINLSHKGAVRLAQVLMEEVFTDLGAPPAIMASTRAMFATLLAELAERGI